MKYNPSFCFLGRTKVLITGMGRRTMLTSVRMLSDASKNHRGFSGMQVPETWALSHQCAAGTQTSIAVKKSQIPKRMAITSIV